MRILQPSSAPSNTAASFRISAGTLAVIGAALITLFPFLLARGIDSWNGSRRFPVVGTVSNLAVRQGDRYVIESPGHAINLDAEQYRKLVEREDAVYQSETRQLRVGLRTGARTMFLGSGVLLVCGTCWITGLFVSRRKARPSGFPGF